MRGNPFFVIAAFVATAGAGFLACIGGDPTDGATPADPCQGYCDAVLSSCTGLNAAYTNAEQCLLACALIPPGKAGDKTTNTVACRLPHAKTGGGKAECASASAFGGDVCGTHCDAFCELVDKNCIQPLGAAAPYPSKSDCLEQCAKFAVDANAGEGTANLQDSANTLNCRMLHALLSLGDRTRHCPHTGIVSATCNVDAGP